MAEPPVTAAVRDKRVEILRTWFRDFEQLLIPVYAPPRLASCQHWTLLSIRRVSNEVQVEYFETLQDMHNIELSGAHTLLSLLEVDKKLLHWQASEVKQVGAQCGWMFCHLIEEKLRVAAGQYKQVQDWPNANRLSKLVAYTKRMVEGLEKERETWAKDHTAEIQKQDDFQKKLRDKSSACLKQKALLQGCSQGAS